MNSTIKLTEADVQNCKWTLVETGDGFRRYTGRGTHPVSGVPIEVMKTEFIEEDNLLRLNAEERNSRGSKRWGSGMGSDKGGNVPMVRVGRIPLNKMFSEIAPRMKEGDKDFLKWWLSRDENQPFRTREGNL